MFRSVDTHYSLGEAAILCEPSLTTGVETRGYYGNKVTSCEHWAEKDFRSFVSSTK